jgi:hypothetical protein
MNQQGPMASTLSAILALLTKLHKHNDVIDKRQTYIEVQINKMNSKPDHLALATGLVISPSILWPVVFQTW